MTTRPSSLVCEQSLTTSMQVRKLYHLNITDNDDGHYNIETVDLVYLATLLQEKIAYMSNSKLHTCTCYYSLLYMYMLVHRIVQQTNVNIGIYEAMHVKVLPI